MRSIPKEAITAEENHTLQLIPANTLRN